MTIHNQATSYTVAAAGDLSAQTARFKVITLAGTVYAIAAGGSTGLAGILTNAPRSGELATYQYAGLCKSVAGAVVTTPGYPLQVASGGFVIAAVSGGLMVGRYWQAAACASGDFVLANLDFSQVPAWGGV